MGKLINIKWFVIFLFSIQAIMRTVCFPLEADVVKRSPHYGGRYFVASVLNQIYGPDALEIVNRFVISNRSAYGNPCDPYAIEGADICENGINESRIEISSDSGILRAYSNNLVCTKLFQCEKCNLYIKQKMPQDVGAWPSDKALDWLIKLFYPNKNASITEMLKNKKENFSNSVYFLCRSGLWQLI
jgi:hypothetical protein